MKQIEISSADKAIIAAEEFLKVLTFDYPEVRCIAFFGKMGVGKTTFIKALCKVLKVKDKVSSPTFSIVNEYETEKGAVIYHFDLYRIKDTREALAAGAEEYIYSNNYCFIEWPETLLDILPDNCLYVSIEETQAGKRIITFDNKI